MLGIGHPLSCFGAVVLLGVAVLFQSGQRAHGQIAVSDEKIAAFGPALEAAEAVLGGESDAPALEFIPSPAEGEDPGTELINGTIVDGTFFPAVFRATTGQTCTASLIGPSTALLAAHCLLSDIALVHFKVANRSVNAICEIAPGFKQRRSEDWALCLLENAVTGIAFESVNISELPALSSRIILTGVGCIQQGEAPAVRPLKAGVTKRVTRPSGLPSGASENAYIYTKSDAAAGQAILCPGDSGGPAFFLHGSTVSDSRMIVGVNSRTDIEAGVGFLSATASQAGADFLRAWADRNGQSVCGLNAGSGVRCMWNPT